MVDCGDGSINSESSSAKFTTSREISRVQGVKAVAQEAWSLDFVRQQQDSCPTLSQIKSLLISKASPPESVDNMDIRVFVKEWPNLSVGRPGPFWYCQDFF